jgi:hypothetical protein
VLLIYNILTKFENQFFLTIFKLLFYIERFVNMNNSYDSNEISLFTL